jgi:hypothetical protein
MDDDSAKSEIKHITEEQANTLYALIDDNNLNTDGKYLPKVLAWLQVEKLDDLPAKKYLKAETAIKGVIAAEKKKREQS